MKKRVFIDTNILISGIFFNGNEAILLANPDIELITSEVGIEFSHLQTRIEGGNTGD